MPGTRQCPQNRQELPNAGPEYAPAPLQTLNLLPGPLGQLGIDPPGQYRIDLDIVLRPGDRHRFGQLNNAGLACGVRRGIGRGEHRHHRSDIDDLAAAGAHHVRISRLRAQKSAGEIGVHHQVPLLRRQIFRLFADRGPCIVDEDVEAAKSPDGILDCLAA